MFDSTHSKHKSYHGPKDPPKPKLTPITVLVDTREQRPWVFGDAVTVERVTLSAGDYSLRGFSDRIVIERKSLDDLVQTISWGRDRFEDEIRRLREFDFACIIAEAEMRNITRHEYESRTAPNAVIGSMVAFFVDSGVPTVLAGNAATAANVAEKMFRRIAEKGLYSKRSAEI